ncbi:glycosyltransferase [Aurantimicrobium minutum]|uniref:glycosyltransferase n=1 Tax=Aurantimicrobium minutum TaxID=708131 RepID=UPI0024764DC3|nr:glycosyltransferase [Aurantimicrobium minutum]MDH6239033.1 glycosyltransferase involved in cell wall biosynthesis [Aurantimicrobium minutum]
MNNQISYTIVVPVYKNTETLEELLLRLEDLNSQLSSVLEVVFVIDGSPDNSGNFLRKELPKFDFKSQLVEHSRNFGAFAAIKTGLSISSGEYVSVMAADLQEPISLTVQIFEKLQTNQFDVVVGRRISRDDPRMSRLASAVFWSLYRQLINPDVPRGGVDMFGCNRKVIQQLIKLNESHSSLIGMLFWVGYRRCTVPYVRQARKKGKSAWTFRKKISYLLDSIFSFTNLPLIVLTFLGVLGVAFTFVAGLFVFISWLSGSISEPGYTPIVLAILFSTFMLMASVGTVGMYVWRTYENSKNRPGAIVMSVEKINS